MPTQFPPSLLSQDQQDRLAGVLDELNREQLLWLSGYLAGRTSDGQAQPEQPAGSADQDYQLSILVGSQTGNAAEVAEQMGARAAEKGVPAQVIDLADYKPKRLKSEQFLALVTSTQGEGDPPDNALDFHEFMMGRKAPKVEGLRYSVLALGDSSYEHFCKTGQDFDNRFSELGGMTLVKRVDCDVEYEDLAEQWIERVLEEVASKAGASQPSARSSPATAAVPEPKYNRKNPFQATILTNQLLSGRGSDKEVRHIELSLEESGLHYNPGDAVGIWPENNPVLVSRVIDAAGFDSEESVTVDEQTMPLSKALEYYREISLLTPPLVKQWAELAGNDELSALTGDSKALRAWMEGRDLLDLMQQWPLSGLTPQTLVNSLRKLPPRLYSISSSQETVDDEVHITVAAVRYHSYERDREGVASAWLSDRLEEGATVPVYIDHNKHFALPEDNSKPIIMIGPGTGIAPFRAFMQEREEREATGENWLFFGDRRFRSDFLYQTDWLKWRQEGSLTRLDTAFSRDQQEEKRYVQHSLRENAHELWRWIENGATLYVCGDAEKMAPDVNDALLEVVSEQGQMARDKAEEYLRQLNREKRYQRDVY